MSMLEEPLTDYKDATYEKLVELLEDMIKTYTEQSDVVLDFTMGSGSTGVACKNLNRGFIGIEKKEEFFDIALNRIGGVDISDEISEW